VFNGGRSSAHGWGIAMSTDTAFALGLLALLGRRFPERLRAYMLTILVVDDVASLVVIATVYTETLKVAPLLAAVGFYVLILVFRSISIRIGLVYFVLGVGAWVGLLKSGVDPVVIGLAIGILPFAFPAERSSLERATERFREFREQPTAELARSVGAQLRSATSVQRAVAAALSPVDELRDRAGVRPREHRHRCQRRPCWTRAFTSPITLGILLG
jgi:Na+/H+ antiporter NhaA